MRRIATLAAVFAVALSAASSVEARNLTISIWGGNYAENIRREIVEKFEKEHNVSVVLDTGTSAERLAKAIASKGQGVDIVYLTIHQMAELSNRGILQPIPAASLPNLQGLYPNARDPLGGALCPSFTVNGIGLVYNKKLMPEGPSSWKDLLRDDLPAKAGFPDMNLSYGPMVLARIAEFNGGSLANFGPGLDAVANNSGKLQFFAKAGQIIDLINQGEISVAPEMNIYVKADPSTSIGYVYPKEGAIGIQDLVCIVKGSPNAELAAKFINFHLSQSVQQAMAQKHGATPVRPDVEVTPGPGRITKDVMEKMVFYNVRDLVSKRRDIIRSWEQKVIAR